MPYVVKAPSARWVDPSEGYELQVGESFQDEIPDFSAIPLTKAQQVAAVLAALPKPMTREQVQTVIIACEGYAKANGLTLAFIYARTKIYTICKDAEAACQAIEAGP